MASPFGGWNFLSWNLFRISDFVLRIYSVLSARSGTSSRMLTGPSAAERMVMSAPKTPAATGAPRDRKVCRKASWSGLASLPEAAPENAGRRPFHASANKVKFETANTPPRTS